MTLNIKKSILGLTFGGLILLGLERGNAVEAHQNHSFLTICRHQSEVRLLRLKTTEQGACVVLYDKGGQETESGRSQQKKTCLEVMSKIQKNLEKVGWKCSEKGASGTSGEVSP